MGFEEPKWRAITVGDVSVEIFFLISGYLIAKSLIKDGSFSRFAAARMLRILPNLFFAVVVTSVITLLFFDNFAHWKSHLQYVAQNIAMLLRGGPMYGVPGIFEGRPETALNGSLWTLPYEVWCYFILFAIMALPHKMRSWLSLLAAQLCVSAFFLANYTLPLTRINLSELGLLGVIFFLGAALANNQSNLPFFSSKRMAWFSRWGDPSYGMYIFAWPVQQFCSLLISNFWVSLATAFLLTTTLGYCTWHGFEKRALAKVETLTRWLDRRGPARV